MSQQQQYQWTSRSREYDSENKELNLKNFQDVEQHPLLPKELIIIQEETKQPEKKEVVVNDPLSSSSITSDPLGVTSDPLGVTENKSLQDDPLGVMKDMLGDKYDHLEEKMGYKFAQPKANEDYFDEGFIPWSSKKAPILQKYTTSEKLQIEVTFLENVPKVQIQGNKTKQRLEELDKEENKDDQIRQVEQQVYVDHVQSLHDELIHAWEIEKNRVKALKIAIRCAKVLGDTQVIRFYPSKFVLISEILDTFGKLVYQRIREKAIEHEDHTNKQPRSLSEVLSPESVTSSARETCKNWFHKIASIRELLPRLYVEMAIIHCYKFLYRDPFLPIFTRITKQLRGIGDPLVATFARAYLARKGYEAKPSLKQYLITSFCDHLEVQMQHITSKKLNVILDNNKIDEATYLDLYSPAVDWLLQCVAHGSKEQGPLLEILAKYKLNKDALTLHHIISNFSPELIASLSVEVTALIQTSNDTGFSKNKLYSTLGVNLTLTPPKKEHQVPVLNEVWKHITKLTEIEDYINLAEIWIEYPVKYCSPKDVNAMLRDILEHINSANAKEKCQHQLQSIAQKILANYPDFTVVYKLSNFMKLVDLFNGEHAVEINKAILKSFSRFPDKCTDPLLAHVVFVSAKSVHDSINSLSFEDERKQVASLLCTFISRVDYGKDVEKQLSFYSESRRAFGFFDVVKRQLVLAVNNLTMFTLRLVGHHNSKTVPFVRACVAFSYITIPSMDSPLTRFELYLHSGQVALVNGAVSQAESLFKSAITLLQDFSFDDTSSESLMRQAREKEEKLVSLLLQFNSTCLIIPGHPELGPFYLIHALIRVVKEKTWLPDSDAKAKIFISLIPLLSSLAQENLIYHIPGVESNDELYAGDEQYFNEIQTIIDTLLGLLLGELQVMKKDNSQHQGVVALDLFNVIVSCCELNPKTTMLASQLFGLASSSGMSSSTYFLNSKESLKHRKGNLAIKLYEKIK